MGSQHAASLAEPAVGTFAVAGNVGDIDEEVPHADAVGSGATSGAWMSEFDRSSGENAFSGPYREHIDAFAPERRENGEKDLVLQRGASIAEMSKCELAQWPVASRKEIQERLIDRAVLASLCSTDRLRVALPFDRTERADVEVSGCDSRSVARQHGSLVIEGIPRKRLHVASRPDQLAERVDEQLVLGQIEVSIGRCTHEQVVGVASGGTCGDGGVPLDGPDDTANGPHFGEVQSVLHVSNDLGHALEEMSGFVAGQHFATDEITGRRG